MAITTKKEDGSVEVEFAGCVVKTFVQEERVMSDVYADVGRAVVYNVEKDAFETVYVRAYFELDRGGREALVDATPEVKALYEAHLAVQEAEAKLNEAKRYRARSLEAMKTPMKGRTIKVVKGRKVPVGTVGTCFYVGQGDYGMRVGLKTAAGETLWTAASNVEAVVTVA